MNDKIKKALVLCRVLAWLPVIYVVKGIIQNNVVLFSVSFIVLLMSLFILRIGEKFIKDRLG